MTGRPNVLVVFRSPDGTGSMKMMHGYSMSLLESGYEIAVLHGVDAGDGRPLPDSAVQLLGELEDCGATLLPSVNIMSSNPTRQVGAILKAVYRRRADVVVAFHQADRAPAALAARLSRRRAVICIQNLHRFHGSAVTRRLKEALYQSAVSRVDVLVASSQAVATELESRFRIDRTTISTVPNAIDFMSLPQPDEGFRARFRAAHGLDDGQLAVLTVGRLDPQKGHDHLIDAIERQVSDELVFFIAGGASAGADSSAHADRIEERARSSPRSDRIRMLGWRDDIGNLLSACDFYVHSSLWEGWPLAVVEAMAAQVPVILTDCAGRPTGFVDGTHGYVVRAGDSNELADAIFVMAETPRDELREMGRAACSLARENYDLATTKAEFRRVFSEVLD